MAEHKDLRNFSDIGNKNNYGFQHKGGVSRYSDEQSEMISLARKEGMTRIMFQHKVKAGKRAGTIEEHFVYLREMKILNTSGSSAMTTYSLVSPDISHLLGKKEDKDQDALSGKMPSTPPSVND